MNTSFDSVKQAISTLTETLRINEAHLAGMLNVTEKSLHEWKKLGVGELTPKAKRLKRTYEAVAFIKNNFSADINTSEIKNVLENGRITIDPNDEEDGTTALISFIRAHPETDVWVPSVKEAVSDYLTSRPQKKGISFESSRPVQKSF